MMWQVMFATKVIVSIALVGTFSFAKPIPICTNIKSYQAYEVAVAVKNRCDSNGIKMSIKDLHKTFLPMMTDEFASVSDCNKDCFLLGTTNGISMKNCIEKNIVGNFVSSMMSSGTYNKQTCLNMKSRIR